MIKSIINTNIHLYEIDEIKSGFTRNACGCWVEIESGAQSITLWMDNEGETDLDKSFTDMIDLLEKMKNAVIEQQEEYKKEK